MAVPVDLPDSSLQVRLVRADEHRELQAVRLRALAYSAHLADQLAVESAEEASFWCERAQIGALGQTMATFIATGSSDVVGIVDGFLSEDRRVVEIGGMWVAPPVRHSGIGRALLAALCAWALSRGAEQAGLWVRAENEPARNLYEREGFKFVRSSDSSGTRSLRLEREL